MSRRSTVVGLLGCALLAAPVASASQGPSASSPLEATAESVPAASTSVVALPEPVVVPAATGARTWASGASPTGVAPDRLSSVVLDAYTRAVALAPERCHLTVPLLAAIGQVESGNLVGRTLDAGHRATPAIVGPRLDGGAFKAVADTDRGQLDGDRKFDRALGPLQFLPSTWRSVAVDLDDDGTRDPQSIYDAAGGAMVYLCGEGRDLAEDPDLRDAVLSYNRSQAYLAQVLRWKRTFEAAELDQLSALPVFSSWAVSAPVDRPRVDVAEAVRPARVAPQDATGTATRPATTGGTSTVPSSPTTGPAVPTSTPGTPSTPGTRPDGVPTTPAATPGTPGTPADNPTGPATPGTTPATPGAPGTPTPAPDPTPEPATIPALDELEACVVPTDPTLPQPAPVDETTHPELVLGETEGTVVLPDGTLVSLEQLCLGEPEVS